MKDFIGYNNIIEHAMRNVVKNVISIVEKDGLKGDHYLVISFSTKSNKNILSPKLLKQHPNEMTIVLQHQFSNLKTHKTAFSVSLTFSGIEERIMIDFSSIISFSDPSTNFGITFNNIDIEYLDNNFESIYDEKKIAEKEIDFSQKVISLDDFRNNNDN